MPKPLIYNKRVEIRMTDDDYSSLLLSSNEKGVTMSEYIRQLIKLK